MFDQEELRYIPRWLRLFFFSYVALVLVVALQQATHLFYGPNIVIHSNGYDFVAHTSGAWSTTLGLLVFPLSWLVIWIGRSLIKGLRLGVISVCGDLLWKLISVEYLDGPAGGVVVTHSMSKASGIALYLSDKTVLKLAADPTQYSEAVFLFAAFLIWLAVIIALDMRALDLGDDAIPICERCGYDMRATQDRDCPECGGTRTIQAIDRGKV